MSTRWRCSVLTIGVIALVAGCASTKATQDFSDVQALVADRGGPAIHPREHLADERVRQTTQTLLAAPLTADRAVQIAVLNSPSFQASYTKLGVARADLVEAGLLENPMFDGELRFGEGGSGTGVEVAIVQDFIGIFQIPLRKKLASIALERAKLDVAHAVLELEREVRQAFYDAQTAQQMLELRQTVAQATDAALDAATKLFDAGNIPPLDLSNEAALHEESLLAIVQAEQRVTETRVTLAQLLGLADAVDQLQIADRLSEPAGLALDADSMIELAMDQRLDVHSAQLARTSAERSLAGTRRFRWFAGGEAGAGADREDGGEWSFGPNLALPLPFFNQGQGAIARAKAQLAAADSEVAAKQLQVRAEVLTATARLTSAQQRAFRYRDRLLPLRHKIVQQTQQQYNAMQVGIFDLLRARQDEIEAGADYLEALSDYWSAHANLRSAVGGMLPTGLSVPATQSSTEPSIESTTAPTDNEPAADEHHHHH